MQKLQELIGEANQFLEHAEVQLGLPLIHVGTLYEVTDRTLGMTQGMGSIGDITQDYSNGVGIGAAVPPEISGLPQLFDEIRAEASKIIAIHSAHRRVMDNLTWLCFNHIEHKFPGESSRSRGGLSRIQIGDTSATFQIAFPVTHGFYATSHVIDLEEIVDGDALQKEPFSQMPPNIMMPDSYQSTNYVPANFDAWRALLESTPSNAKKHTMYRSKTADVLGDFRGMVEELMAA